MSAGQLPPPGTRLRKFDRNGNVRCEAVVGQNGQVIYRGVTYSSISAAAKVAAGDIGLATRSCDGYAFFGLKGRGDAGAAPRTPRAPRSASAATALPLPLPVRWDDLPSAAAPPVVVEQQPVARDDLTAVRTSQTLVDSAAPIVPTEPVPRTPLTEEIVLATVFDHSRHGRADERGVPLEPDCACRNTTREEACAQAGCGYCRAARMCLSGESITSAAAPASAAPEQAPAAPAPETAVGQSCDHSSGCTALPPCVGVAPAGEVLAPSAIIVRDGKILLALRPEGKSQGGKWETPGGKAEPGETAEDASVAPIETGGEGTSLCAGIERTDRVDDGASDSEPQAQAEPQAEAQPGLWMHATGEAESTQSDRTDAGDGALTVREPQTDPQAEPVVDLTPIISSAFALSGMKSFFPFVNPGIERTDRVDDGASDPEPQPEADPPAGRPLRRQPLPVLLASTVDVCDVLGQHVHEVRTAWAREQFASELLLCLTWEQLSELEREMCRRIGATLFELGVNAKVDAKAEEVVSL